MTIEVIAAILFCCGLAFVIGFQICLLVGAPWGAYTMGGRFQGALPLQVRVGVAIQALVLMNVCKIMLIRIGLINSTSTIDDWLMWLLVAFFVVSWVLNLITPSRFERRLWLPVVTVLIVTLLIVTLRTSSILWRP